MEECIFCNIVSGKIPAIKVYEDDTYLAFMDIFPRVKGHALLIPKKHYRYVYDVPEFGTYWEKAREISMKVKAALGVEYISFVTMGEAVPHAHIHILPQEKHKVDGIHFAEVKSITKEEIQNLASQIKKLF